MSYGSLFLDGYYNTQIKKKPYKIHVLVFLAFINNKPTSEYTVDHKDRDQTNNVFENLRLARNISNF